MPDCPDCGRPATEGDLFCRGCGTEFPPAAVPAGGPGVFPVIATLGPTTPWAGKTISLEHGQFSLEGVGVLTAENLLVYDSKGHLIWATEGMREWVVRLAAKSTPAQRSDEGLLVPPEPPPSTVAKPVDQPRSELGAPRRRRKRMMWAAIVVVTLAAVAAIVAVALSSTNKPEEQAADAPVLRHVQLAPGYMVSFDPARFTTGKSDSQSAVELEAAGQTSPMTSLSFEVDDDDYTALDLTTMVAGIIKKTTKASGSAGAVSPVSLVEMPQLGATGLSFDAAVTSTDGQLHFRLTYLLEAEKLITVMASTDAEQWPDWQSSLSDMSLSLRKSVSSASSSQLLSVARTMSSPVKMCAFPDVAGETVAFEGTDSTLGKARIYVQDPIRLTTYPVSRARAKVSMASTSPQRVVWMQDPPGGSRDFDIWAYDLAQGIALPICDAAGWQGYPDVAGDWIVWSDDREGDTNIYGYRWSTKSEQHLVAAEGEQVSPRTDGHWVVWEDQRSGSGFQAEKDIYGLNLETGQEIPICTAPGDQLYASVSDGYVVWKDFRHGAENPDIYGFDLAHQEEFVISDSTVEQSEPAVTNGQVIYRSAVAGSDNSILMGYEIASGTTSEVYSSDNALGFCRAGDGTFVFLNLGLTGPTTLRMLPRP